jgi:hypothetical protein
MCTAAPIMNRIMKTVCAGMSTLFMGAPPSAHAVGGYGGFVFSCTSSALVNCVQLSFNLPLKEVGRPALPLYQTIKLQGLLFGCWSGADDPVDDDAQKERTCNNGSMRRRDAASHIYLAAPS